MKHKRKPRKAHDRKHKYIGKDGYNFPPTADPPVPDMLRTTADLQNAPIETTITDEDDITWDRVPDTPDFPLPWQSRSGMNADHSRIAMSLPAKVNHYPI